MTEIDPIAARRIAELEAELAELEAENAALETRIDGLEQDLIDAKVVIAQMACDPTCGGMPL